MFPEWVSCFYDHHLSPSFPSTPIVNPKVELSLTALADPPSTFSTLSPADVETIVYPGPALDGGSDFLLFEAGQRLGTFDEMRRKALFGPGRDVLQSSSAVTGMSETGRSAGDWWKSVEVRVIWCDRSIWPVLWGIQALHRELEDAKAAHKVRVGRVNIVRIKGANHYPHWEEPEQTLRVLLSEDGAEEEDAQAAKL
ncbi:uncharacterized protein STEHIDRAFT_114985 [Stereum hirsutum FP-91666 SS1]|uniref:uncharacterized protein n=1 Tax=Stereum hirsutum (strain FP-91666) TaxID=721885 RepID=UPI000444A80C|nr:uncharacterized protein STEHIDRAFT_114985 [Stereum hirsutum FP-91666 SS1]EIM81569.1 hypothetical protein STEHIDRAFT_114985 [Stereum hirsutum FP-91666 SS1]